MPIQEILDHFDGYMRKKKPVGIAGRIRAIRIHGGSSFWDIEDARGEMQIYMKRDSIGKKSYDLIEGTFDTGDIVWAWGKPFRTRKNEETLEVTRVEMLAKSLRPLPEKWHGLLDIEERYRKRYLDLIMNPEVRRTLILRSRITRELRTLFEREGFLEVETPILQPIPGGALARPFKTHLNALDIDLYLRIAPELYLKRLLVGHLEKVFELGRVFRNEGIDKVRNPEFTILEAYVAYEDAEGLMKFVERILSELVLRISGKTSVTFEEKTISFKHPWKSIEFGEFLKTYAGIDPKTATQGVLKQAIAKHGVKVGKQAGKWELVDELYKKICLPRLSDPTFVTHHPIEISPLAKRSRKDPGRAARFQLIVGGYEVVNAFSELNDPQDQMERFQAQKAARKAGEEETHEMDLDFVEALEYGMPPAAGLGIGVDRLAIILTNSKNIRDVLLFPTMRPKK